MGKGGAISEERAERLLAKIDHGGSQRNLFVRVKEIDPPQKHRILTHMINCGFKSTTGTELQIPGETQFDLQTVLKNMIRREIAPVLHRIGQILPGFPTIRGRPEITPVRLPEHQHIVGICIIGVNRHCTN